MATTVTRFACCACSVHRIQRETPEGWRRTTAGTWCCATCAALPTNQRRFRHPHADIDEAFGVLYDPDSLRFGHAEFYPALPTTCGVRWHTC